jgi:hypothetical protein
MLTGFKTNSSGNGVPSLDVKTSSGCISDGDLGYHPRTAEISGLLLEGLAYLPDNETIGSQMTDTL